MRRVIVFLMACSALVLLISYLSSYAPGPDPFDPSSASTLSSDSISQSTIAKMKLRHAALYPTSYDVGLFGNSRALGVSAEDIDHQACQIFNFAIPGESLRATAALLEDLATINKIPRVIVISADHFELQMYNNPFFISAWTRLQHFFNDLGAAIDAGADLRQIVTVTWRAVWTQTLAFQRMFEYAFLADAVSRAFGFEMSASDTSNVYVSDGSRRIAEKPSGTPPILSPTTGQILPWQLRHDLKRIAMAKSSGAEAVIIYESPLHPKSAEHFNANPTPHAAGTREVFQEACTELGLVCVTNAPPAQAEAIWSDATHAPASVLGPHISTLIAPYKSDCGS